MHKELHPRDDLDRLYAPRKEGVATIEDSIDTSIQWLEDCSHQKQYWQHKDQQNKNN